MRALITGATSGIGKDMAFLLSCKGYDLILASRNTEEMQKLQEKLKTHVQIITVDLSIEADCYELYEMVCEQDIDILINNSGFGYHGAFWENPLENDLDMIHLNIKAVHILTSLFLKKFREADKGYILNVASFAGFFAGPLMSTYYATKNYVVRLSEGIYEELRRERSNVHISVLCPGPVETNFNERAGAVFATKGQSSMEVAKMGLKGMFAKDLLILTNPYLKIGYFLKRFVCEKILLKVTYLFQYKKMNEKE